jgi:hypothetical protein
VSSSGTTGSTGTLTLAVDANPNNVLSAVATVSATPDLDIEQVGVHVVDMSGNDAGLTPTYGMTGSSTIVPVLMLRASSSYTLQALGWLGDGGLMTSNIVAFQTSPLPPGVPSFEITDGGMCPSGYTLIANSPTYVKLDQPYYAAAVDCTGQPVWYLTLPPEQGLIGDFHKQPNHTYTVATNDPTVAIPNFQTRFADFIQFDVLGNPIHEWRSPDALATNEHEFRLQPDGSGLFFGYISEVVDMSLIADGGKPNATVYGSKLERVTPDGGILFSWSDFDNVPLTDIDPALPSTTEYIDAYHSNAIDVVDGGDYLISHRNMSQILKIDSTSGDIEWILGGVESQFTFINDRFNGPSFQHGARELPNGDIICFDNGDGRRPYVSRAVEYALDLNQMTATLVWEYERPKPTFAAIYGFAERLKNGDTLVTYGSAGIVDEVEPDGGLAWELTDALQTPLPDGGSRPTDLGIYRSFRVDSLY